MRRIREELYAEYNAEIHREEARMGKGEIAREEFQKRKEQIDKKYEDRFWKVVPDEMALKFFRNKVKEYSRNEEAFFIDEVITEEEFQRRRDELINSSLKFLYDRGYLTITEQPPECKAILEKSYQVWRNFKAGKIPKEQWANACGSPMGGGTTYEYLQALLKYRRR